MGAAAEAPGVDIPFEGAAAHLELAYPVLELLEVGLPLGAAYDFSYLGEEHVHGPDGLAVLVLLHVEGLDVLRVAGQNHGLAEMLFHEVALVLALQVGAPVHGIFELHPVLRSFLKYSDALGVFQPHEFGVHHAFEPCDQLVVVAVVEELDVVAAVLNRIPDEVLDEVLGQVHVVVDVVERHFGLYHPEFREVARGVGVLRAEGRPEGVDLAERGRSELPFELSAHGQARLLAEEVLAVVDFALLVPGDVVEVKGRHREHLARTLGIGCGDEGSVQIYEALGMEIFVDCEGHLAAEPEDCAEGVGSGTHVRHCPEVFEGGVLLLQGIAHGVALTVDGNLLCLDLHALSATHGFHELAPDAYAGSGADSGKFRSGLGVLVHDHLDVLDCRSVVQGYEGYLLVPAFCSHPSFSQDFMARLA